MQTLKTHVNIYIESSAYLQARANGINLSQLLNEYLKKYLEQHKLTNPKVNKVRDEMAKLKEKERFLEQEMVNALAAEQHHANEMENKLKRGKQTIASLKASGVIGAK